ncbi:protein of unknown function [Denitratisoma oestradiolicum]|uniref:Uncharacterized protein n=1 Tax=Denitratisoma oestradiolicum TaxID=311182 RepID=A0A6S6Y2Y6_9PROT|nr:protein of unknown function [Denitratisoma oestradiolicum]
MQPGLSSAIGIEVAWLLGNKCIGLQLENPLPLSKTERNYFLDSLPDLRPNRTGGNSWKPGTGPGCLICSAGGNPCLSSRHG